MSESKEPRDRFGPPPPMPAEYSMFLRAIRDLIRELGEMYGQVYREGFASDRTGSVGRISSSVSESDPTLAVVMDRRKQAARVAAGRGAKETEDALRGLRVAAKWMRRSLGRPQPGRSRSA